MFKTQGTEYELTTAKIQMMPVQSLVRPTPEPVKPLKPVTMLTRKSSMYQVDPPAPSVTTAYVKYGKGEDESDDGDSDSDRKSDDCSSNPAKPTVSGPAVMANFDSPSIKRAMLEMNTLNTAATATPMTNKVVGRSVDTKKRFPEPGQSSTMNQLFWCAYIACKGEVGFDTITNAFVRETEFKYETIEAARGEKHLIKPAFKRYKLSLPNFEAEIISSKRTTLQLMAGIVLCHNQKVLYIDGRLFIEIKRGDNGGDAMLESESSSVYTVIEKIKNRYCIYKDTTGTEVARCNNELLKMESIDAPIRSISYYKVKDLEEMCKRLSLNVAVIGTKKADLYDEILKYVQSSGVTV